MKQLLLEELSELGRNISIDEKIYIGQFGFSDWKSCGNCINHFSRTCDHTIFKVNSKRDVHALSLERIILDTKDENLRKGGICDLIMYDEDKLTLAELTCSLPHYLEQHTTEGEQKEGKRPKAYRQLNNAIARLRSFDKLDKAIVGYSQREAIFACREKETAFLQEDKGAKAMQSFRRRPKPKETDMGNGFIFKRIDYPEVYEW